VTGPAGQPPDVTAARAADVPVALPARGTTARRRLGALLVAFGAAGILLLGTSLAFVAGPVDADEGPLGLEAQRRLLVALLDTSARSIDSAATAARDADSSLGSTSVAAASAATLMTELSATMRQLAASLRVSFLGTQPFAPAADDMDRVATQAATVAADLDVAASSVRLAAEDMAVLADDLAGMRAEIDRIRGRIAGRIEADGWRLMLGATLAWLAIPAVVSVAIGLRWLRPAGRTGGARTPVPPPAPRRG
jgi:hypothetical protein